MHCFIFQCRIFEVLSSIVCRGQISYVFVEEVADVVWVINSFVAFSQSYIFCFVFKKINFLFIICHIPLVQFGAADIQWAIEVTVGKATL